MKRIIVICGPTASGKTAIAHKIGQNIDAEIVNADSMQVYNMLPIITASPGPDITSELNYHLYNFLEIGSNFSVAEYALLARDKIYDIVHNGKVPIIVGGSGLYIQCLVEGFCSVPTIPLDIRSFVREEMKIKGANAIYEELILLDPLIKDRLTKNDPQRLSRAFEVILATGKSIFEFQALDHIRPLEDFVIKSFFMLPERNLLHLLCMDRLRNMFVSGAIEEVEIATKINGFKESPISKALGVSEITDYIEGRLTKAEALEKAAAKTRQYAKRQITWFKHQLKFKETMEFADIEGFASKENEIYERLT